MQRPERYSRLRGNGWLVLAVSSAVVVGVSLWAAAAGSSSAGPRTVVAISGTRFYINGAVTNRGSRVQGLLMNSRMVQATFDDENASTAANWRYPDTNRWSAARNTSEFVKAVPRYAASGLDAVTINLQGGSPTGRADSSQQNVTGAFRPNGALKRRWLDRVDRVIRACARNHIAVIVGFFYFGQDQRLLDERAVTAAADNATAWLVRKHYTNVLVEIANEANLNYEHNILKPDRVHELIRRIRIRSRGRLDVSTSFAGGAIPAESVIRESDFILLHGNGQSADAIREMIDRVRATPAYRAAPKPIVFNEDSARLANLEAAVQRGASWGYYDQGSSNYIDGFQSPPVNWRINTATKKAFFGRIAILTGGR